MVQRYVRQQLAQRHPTLQGSSIIGYRNLDHGLGLVLEQPEPTLDFGDRDPMREEISDAPEITPSDRLEVPPRQFPHVAPAIRRDQLQLLQMEFSRSSAGH